MSRRPRDRPQVIVDEANRMFRGLRSKGYSGAELRQISHIIETLVETVPEHSRIIRLDDELFAAGRQATILEGRL